MGQTDTRSLTGWVKNTEIRKAIKSKTQKTLIVTEGATDWRHLKSALRGFQSQEESRYKNLDIEFLEYNPRGSKEDDLPKLDMSCSHLTTMCKEFAKLQQSRKIIFIADADDTDTVKNYLMAKISIRTGEIMCIL